MPYRSKRKWHELDLLCRAGVGIAPIAPAICRTLREIFDAAAVSLFWLDERGMPAGIFHENAAASALDLFVKEYERLFTGPSEIDVSQIAVGTGRPAGFLMKPGLEYFRSNTFNLLVRASGHFHTLDLRVDVANQARAVVMLFRERQNPFDDADAPSLAHALPHLKRAIERQSAAGPWERSDMRGYLLVDRTGTRLLAMSEEASQILKACTIVGQNVRLAGPMTLPPAFAENLCRRLETAPVVQDTLDMPLGRLRLIATPLHAPAADTAARVLISLEVERPKRLKTIENILDLTLSPLQRSIALVAALGGTRADSLTSAGISNEALKKHLAVIYRATGVKSWEELAKALQ
ncbi:MAG: hypothetical protein WDN01_10865 [Rhizomicrobium sp.]